MLVHGPVMILAAFLAGPLPVGPPDLLPDEVKATLIDIGTVAAALDVIYEEHGEYPSTDNELVRLESVTMNLDGVYRDRVPTRDAWRQSLLYASGGGRRYVLISKGSDQTLDEDYEDYDVVTRQPLHTGKHMSETGCDIVRTEDGIEKAPMTHRSRQKQTMADLRSLGTAIEAYAVDNNEYPYTTGWVPIAGASALNDLQPIYIRTAPVVDGWGNPILIFATGDGYILVSTGSDGLEDTPYATYDNPHDVIDGGAVNEFARDVIFADGQFVQWPKATQQ